MNVSAGLGFDGVFHIEHLDKHGNVKDSWFTDNMVVNEGLNYALNVALQKTANKPAAIGAWYVGLFSGNYTPLATVTGATIAAAATEFTGYSQATRVLWDEADTGATAQIITNASGTGATKATFSITAGSPTVVYGLFLAEASAKGAVTGKLWCAARFSAAKTVENGETLNISYSVQAASV